MKQEQTKELIKAYDLFILAEGNEREELKEEIENKFLNIKSPSGVDYYTYGLFNYSYYENIGTDSFSQKEFEDKTNKTIIYFKKSLSIDENYYMSNYYLGHCYQDLKDYKTALDYYLKVDQGRLKKDFPIWRYLLLFELIGYCNWKLGNKNKSIEYYNICLKECFKINEYIDIVVIGSYIEQTLGQKHTISKELEIHLNKLENNA